MHLFLLKDQAAYGGEGCFVGHQLSVAEQGGPLPIAGELESLGRRFEVEEDDDLAFPIEAVIG